MKRFNLSILIALIAALLVNFESAMAATTWYEDRQVFMTDFRDGVFYGALLSKDGDSYQAITMQYAFDNGVTQEDFFDAYGNMLPTRVQLDDRGYTGIMRMYSAEYNKMIRLNYTAYTDSAHIVGYVNTASGVTSGTLDGDIVQFTGFVQNGEAIKLRSANVLAQVHASGYLLQNGNLISYVATDKEESTPVVLTPRVYMASITR